MKKTLVVVYAIALMAIQSGCAQAPLGLQVKDGHFYKDGHVYRGVGANYFDLFRRVMNNPVDTTSLAGLERLAQAGIPFVRFAGPYSAEEWKLYVDNKEEYFRRFDLVVRRAEQVKIGLIPSMFWTLTLCETVNESRDQWGNPQSKTSALMRQYVSDVVGRYKNSPALWAYEFGNEMNLAADLPNADKFRPKNGTVRDDITAKHLVTMLSEFAKAVRSVDPSRAIISGNSHSRASAWNNTASKSWTADTQAQAKEIILRDNPAPLDTVGIHFYGDHKPEKELGNWVLSRLAYLKWLRGIADEVKRPIFIGEYGCAIQASPEKNRETYEALLKEMTETNIDMAAFWVYDLPSQNKDWNVTFENERSYMIKLTIEANSKWNNKR